MKTCSKCCQTKKLEDFPAQKRNRDGKGSHCNACCSIKSKVWAKNNPDKNYAGVVRWRQVHKDENRIIQTLAHKVWRHSNPEKSAARLQKYRTAKTKAGGSYTVQEWQELIKLYDYKCLRCGKKKKLTVDHVISVNHGGTSNIDNLQPLCGSCNSSKGKNDVDYRRV